MLLSIPQVAQLMGVDVRTVRRAAREGTLPGVRTVSHRTYVSKPVLLHWLYEDEPTRQTAATT